MPGTSNYSLLEHILFPPTSLNEKKLAERLRHKTVLVTGASYGIGESLAYLLAGTGAQLILVARTKEKLEEVQANVTKRGGKALIIPTDLTQPAQVQQLTDHLLTLPHGIDVVISNAGKSIRRSLFDSLDRHHDVTRTIGVNYLGPVQLILALIPMLEKNKGHIVNISAINALLAPAPYWAAYQASKAAFDNWFRSAAPELNTHGVTTTSIYLPLVKTRMITPTPAYDNLPAMRPQHVTRIIAKCLIDKCRRHAPWWLIFPQLASVLFRSTWERLSVAYLKKKKPLC